MTQGLRRWGGALLVAVAAGVPAAAAAQGVTPESLVGMWKTPKVTEGAVSGIEYYRWLEPLDTVINGRRYGLMTETKVVNDTFAVRGCRAALWTVVDDSVVFLGRRQKKLLPVRRTGTQLAFEAVPEASPTSIEALPAPPAAPYQRVASLEGVPGSAAPAAGAAVTPTQLVGKWLARVELPNQSGPPTGKATLELLPNGTWRRSTTRGIGGGCGTWSLSGDLLRLDNGIMVRVPPGTTGKVEVRSGGRKVLEQTMVVRSSDNDRRVWQVKNEGEGAFLSPFDAPYTDWLKRANTRPLALAETFDRADEPGGR